MTLTIKQDGNEDVYDFTVSNAHNFFVNDVLVHNCGEQTLAPGNICCLGNINLTQFVKDDQSGFDLASIKKYAGYMVRFLDNVNSYSSAPLPEYEESMRNKRRVGIGVMGWGSALFMMKTRFGSAKAATIQEELMRVLSTSVYEASIDLAIEKGKFEYCIPEKHADAHFIKGLGLSDEYMEKLRTVGIRNSSLLSCQPTGNSSIMANIVSGGIEPVFLPEYVRTAIVPNIPQEILDKTPKFYEGAWEETDLFKFDKEGDEEILKGVHEGVTYKIDKSRGLVKEVLCEDYGVRWLKARGQWDPSADWAATTSTLAVEDHVNDLKGFARWTDAACSKTASIPFDYPYEDFKNLYMQVYKTGFIKGFTTYRSGTMSSVLSAKDEKDATQADEEIVLADVKMADSAPASVKVLRADGKKWYVTVVLNEQQNRPFALFVHTNHAEKSVTTHDAVERLANIAATHGVPQVYVADVLKKISKDDNASKVARMISLNLRHGILIKNIVATLDSMENVFVGSFIFQIKKYLASFIKDGEKAEGEKCSECGSDKVVYREGCKICLSCANSRC